MELPEKEESRPGNNPPVIKPYPQVFVNEGEEIVVQPQISDPDGDVLTIDFGGWAPGGYSVDKNDPTQPVWRFRTGYGNAGNYSIWVSANDGKATIRKDILISINNVNRSPECPLSVLQAVDELSTLQFVFRASDPDAEDNLHLLYGFKWLGQMPSGVTNLVIDPIENAVNLSLTPDFGTRGLYLMEFSVTDPSVPSYNVNCSVSLEVRDILLWEKAGVFPDLITQAVVNALVVDPYSSVVYAGLSDFSDPSIPYALVPSRGYGVYEYFPQLNDWTEVNTGLSELRVTDLKLKAEANQTLIFAATWGGVYRYNGVSWEEASEGIPHKNRQIFSLELDSQGKLWAGPGMFSGPLYFSSDDALTWSYSSGITDLIKVYDLASGGSLFFASVFRKSISYYNSVIQSLDRGVAWGENITFRNMESRVIAFDPFDSQNIFVGVENQGMYRSLDGGITWAGPIQIAVTNSYPRAILPVAYADYPNTVLVGLTEKGIWRSRDGGTTFTAQNNGLPEGISVRSIAVEPFNLDRIYIGTEYHGVYRTKIP